MTVFETSITASSADIDELGHVNNAVWVRWIQDVATAHWYAVAPADRRDSCRWVVARHEIDYLRSVTAGETVTARTWVADEARGARFDRFVEFSGAEASVRVRARTIWALVDAASGRPLRVPADVIAAFNA